MFGFRLDENGDLLVEDGVIRTISGDGLTAQTVQTLLGTNKGEWFLNGDEGLRFRTMLGKNVTEDMIQAQIEDGLRQVDESLHLEKFRADFDRRGRSAKVLFSARRADGTGISGEKTYE